MLIYLAASHHQLGKYAEPGLIAEGCALTAGGNFGGGQGQGQGGAGGFGGNAPVQGGTIGGGEYGGSKQGDMAPQVRSPLPPTLLSGLTMPSPFRALRCCLRLQ